MDCVECSKHTSGECFDCQQITNEGVSMESTYWIAEEARYAEDVEEEMEYRGTEDREMQVFGGILDEAMQYGVLPESMPATVVDVEEWMLARLEDAGVCESILSYWRGNLNSVRGIVTSY